MSENLNEPQSRTEIILQNALGEEYDVTPQSRVEILLTQIFKGGGAGKGGFEVHICASGEYDATTKVPTIATPDPKTLYLVPSSDTAGNLFDEYIYVDNKWEKFGGVQIEGWAKNIVDGSGAKAIIQAGAKAASGNYSFARGFGTQATGEMSYAEGSSTTASGPASHAEGSSTTASGQFSHAEGFRGSASGNASHVEGSWTIAQSSNQHVFGTYNVADNTGKYVEIVGNGDSVDRSNARTLDWSGNEWLAGTLTLGNTTLTEADIIALHTPAEGGEY